MSWGKLMRFLSKFLRVWNEWRLICDHSKLLFFWLFNSSLRYLVMRFLFHVPVTYCMFLLHITLHLTIEANGHWLIFSLFPLVFLSTSTIKSITSSHHNFVTTTPLLPREPDILNFQKEHPLWRNTLLHQWSRRHSRSPRRSGIRYWGPWNWGQWNIRPCTRCSPRLPFIQRVWH